MAQLEGSESHSTIFDELLQPLVIIQRCLSSPVILCPVPDVQWYPPQDPKGEPARQLSDNA